MAGQGRDHFSPSTSPSDTGPSPWAAGTGRGTSSPGGREAWIVWCRGADERYGCAPARETVS